MPKKNWTPEERAAASERAKANAAARRAGGATAVAERSDRLSVAPSADPLKDLAALIVQASSSDAEQDRVLDQLTTLVERINFNQHPELRDHPAMQTLFQQLFDREQAAPQPDGRIAPGTINGTGLTANAVPWTWQHVEFLRQQEPDGMFKLKTVACSKTQQIIINGLSVWFPEGQTIEWYAPWVDQYLASNRAAADATRHAQWLFKVGPWNPAIPTEMQPAPSPDWLEDEGVRLRAEGEGMYRPGMGWNPNVDGQRWMQGMPGTPAPAVAPVEVPEVEGAAD